MISFSEGPGERMLSKRYVERWLEKWQKKDEVPKVQAGHIELANFIPQLISYFIISCYRQGT